MVARIGVVVCVVAVVSEVVFASEVGKPNKQL